MSLRNSPRRSLLVAVLLALAAGAEPAKARAISIVIEQAQLRAEAPAACFDGVGCRAARERFYATGHSTAVVTLGPGKDQRSERDFAEDDARTKMLIAAAREKDPAFDEDSYRLTGKIDGLQVVATYRVEGEPGLYLLAMARQADVHAKPVFDPAQTGRIAREAFEHADYARASRLCAALTAHGVQDRETAALARAASAHVNLDAGLTGAARAEALKTLAEFHRLRGEDELALKFSYELYRGTSEPDRNLLERLAELSTRTHRPNNAAAFRRELERRFPEATKP